MHRTYSRIERFFFQTMTMTPNNQLPELGKLARTSSSQSKPTNQISFLLCHPSFIYKGNLVAGIADTM